MGEKSSGGITEQVGNDERSVGEKVYKQFLNTVRANVGGVQPPMAARTSVSIIFCNYSDYSTKTLNDALEVACNQREQAIEWMDEDGRECIGLRLSAYDEINGLFPYDETDVDAIMGIIETEVAREQPDQEVVGWANTHLSEIETRGDEDSDSESDEANQPPESSVSENVDQVQEV